MQYLIAIFLLSLRIHCGAAKQGYGTGEQDWGYVDVREGAHMFYWLHYTIATPNYIERPLVIWLQGGPGQSSAGFGNFKEIGPLDVYGNERNTTWIKDVNVLFIDNPVGSGFSYVDDESNLTTNLDEITNDLITFMKVFLEKHAEFENVPLHIFGESYGGKMAAKFTLELYYAIQRKELNCKLTSVVLISPSISPEDEVMSYAPLLLYMGIVDYVGYNKIMAAAEKTREFIQSENWMEAFEQGNETFVLLLEESKCIDYYNILALKDCSFLMDPYNDLTELMQGPVCKNLSIPTFVEWTALNSTTFWSLRADIMVPVVNVVSELLDKTNLQVGVVAGQLDLIIPLASTVKWTNQLDWRYRSEYLAAPRNEININGFIEGQEKSGGKLSTFSIYRAGHMVPADNPKAMKYILRKFTNYG